MPLVRYGKRDGVLHPVGIAKRMLRFYGTGFEGRAGDRKAFKRILLASMGSKQLNGPGGKLEYGFDFTAGTYRHKFKIGWGSAMAQGVMLSVLARGYREYPNLRSEIIRYGERLMRPLTIPAARGGLLYNISVGNNSLRFYEEYPVPETPPLTLNGFMFTLIGLHEFHALTGSNLASQLFAAGIKTLANILPFYDTRPLSTYDLSHLMYEDVRPNISPRYHGVHIRQLDYLYGVTGEPILACVRDSMLEKQADVESQYGTDMSREDYQALRWHTPLTWDDQCASHFEQPLDVYAAQSIH